MLLGQIVAISFAQNLFFAMILVSKRPESSQDKNKSKDKLDEDSRALAWLPPPYCEILPVTLSLLSTVLVPSVAHSKYFIAILLIPHLLLFVPAVLRTTRSLNGTSSGTTKADDDRATRRYAVFFRSFVGICVIVQAHATYLALQAIGTSTDRSPYAPLARKLLGAVYEHPAVSSVSWDVIFCAISVVSWMAVNGGSVHRMLGGQ